MQAEPSSAVALREGLRRIEAMAHGLRFASATGVVQTRAQEMFRDLNAVKTIRVDVRDAHAAAALYMACKMENAGREIAVVAAACGVATSSVTSAYSSFREKLADKPYAVNMSEAIRADSLINSFVDQVAARVSSMTTEQQKRVKCTAHRLNEYLVTALDCSRAPRTVCSGLIYVAIQRESVAVPKRAVLEACNVCQQTLDKMVMELQRCLVLRSV